MKHLSNRRDFLKAGSGLMGMAFLGKFSDLARPLPLLSFSTLGCPDWTFPAILTFAAANNYQGIEIRGIQRQLDLTLCPEFNSDANIRSSRRMVEDKGLTIVGLGASAELHHAGATERQHNLDDGRKFIDLAHKLGCPNVRVFPNKLPKEQNREVTLDLIAKGLLELAAHARGSGVTVLMETHGDVVHSEDLQKIMEQATDPGAGLVWDVYNMWSVTKESPSQVYDRLKKYIRHTHIKDGKSVDGKEQYTLMGQGEAPIFQAIDLLVAGGYNHFFSFEWEKMWHPEIAAPEIALADYPMAMKRHFGS
ncbi:sugar phosphate isomerase/epimerase family protein [Flavitalea flava]